MSDPSERGTEVPKAKTVPYGRSVRYGEEELEELRQALAQGTLFYAQGAKVHQLEETFAAMVGARHAVACTSGTAAIHTALIALSISPGDEVITSPITDMGSVIPILYQGAVPVFADLHPRTYVMTPESVEAAITPNTRAVLAVHLAGNACDLDGLRTVCDRYGVPLVEDCAQAHGCTYKGKSVGTFGTVGCFSFNEFKHVSCGDGGLVVTDDDELAVRLRLATDKCYDRRAGVAQRNPTFLANNYRMTELQGAVALAQCRKLADIVERRRRWCSALTERLEGTPGLMLPSPTPSSDPSWWFYMMRVTDDCDADAMARAMADEGIPVGAHYIGTPVYTYPIFTGGSAFVRGHHAYQDRTYGEGLCPSAEAILRTCLILSINEGYTQQDLDETVLGMRRAAERVAASGPS
jgi:dTDP-4-amino-4,6-dideoxygalactose transaminase